jgi:ribosomal protein L40E
MAGAMTNAMNQPKTESPSGAKSACPKCGAANLANAKFCTECGEKMQTGAQTVPCVKCGAALAAGSKFCNECGTKQGE